MNKTSKANPKERNDRQHRLQTVTIRLVNSLDRTKKKSLNKKIFTLLNELKELRFRIEGLEK